LVSGFPVIDLRLRAIGMIAPWELTSVCEFKNLNENGEFLGKKNWNK